MLKFNKFTNVIGNRNHFKDGYKKVKTITLTFVLFVSAYSMQGQTTDKIIKINNDTLEVTVTGVLERMITYSYPNETVTIIVNKQIVKQIIYRSGRIEDIEPIIINGEADFEKVIVTRSSQEVLGLEKKGEVEGKATKINGRANTLNSIATDNLKKEAAKNGAFIVLIKSNDVYTAPGPPFTTVNTVRLTGVAYGY
jgi:hypothetical protein